MSSEKEQKSHFIFLNITVAVWTTVMFVLFPACSRGEKNLAEAITERDSLPSMKTLGVTTLISDSGVTRYRVNTEEWLIFDKKKPSYWAFEKGIYLEQFDSLFHIDASIKADTAYYYDRDRLWKLIGNVDIKSLKGDHVTTELLYWNEATKKVYTDKFVRMEKPDQIMTGYGFESDDQFMKPVVHNISGIVYIDEDAEKAKTDSVN